MARDARDMMKSREWNVFQRINGVVVTWVVAIANSDSPIDPPGVRFPLNASVVLYGFFLFGEILSYPSDPLTRHLKLMAIS